MISIPALDDLVKSYTSKPVYGLAGVAIMAVDNRDKVVYSGAFGKRSLDPVKEEGMTLDTVQWLGKSRI